MKRPWLLPLVPLWAAGVAYSNWRAARQAEQRQALQAPVISVGSLSAGGAGKTPFAIALAEALRSAGWGVDILSRGYSRTATGAMRVNPMGSAGEFGDEPLLMARTLGMPVYVAAERLAAGLLAERERRHRREDRGPHLHLLDDGFQHRQLKRAVDIVLLTAADVADTLIPAGDLREPLKALYRADVIALRGDEEEGLRPVLARVFQGRTMPAVWTIDREIARVEGPPVAKPFLFCGIARPDGFRDALAAAGVEAAGLIALQDHHQYTDSTVRSLLLAAKKAAAGGLATTAKDAVKLTPEMRRQLAAAGPLAVYDVRVRLRNQAECMGHLLSKIEGWK